MFKGDRDRSRACGRACWARSDDIGFSPMAGFRSAAQTDPSGSPRWRVMRKTRIRLVCPRPSSTCRPRRDLSQRCCHMVEVRDRDPQTGVVEIVRYSIV